MKVKVKFFSILAIFVSLICMNSIHILAEEPCESCHPIVEQDSSSIVIARARVCICGNGTYNVVSKQYGNHWENYQEVDCIHKVYGTDMIQRRPVLTTYVCDYCGRGYDTTTYETRRICHGYNS